MNKKNFKNLLVFSICLLCVAVFSLHAAFIEIIGCAAFALRFYNPSTSALIHYRKHYNSVDAQPLIFVPISSISSRSRKILVKVEDPGFYFHNGIHIPAMRMAYTINKKAGKPVYGASTITQQLTRTMFLFPKKVYYRKYMEIIAALTIEKIVSKERILELYINYMELGPGIFGLGRASEYYYHKPLVSLSEDQIERLIVILPNPINYTPDTFIQSQSLLLRYQFIQKMKIKIQNN